MMKKMVWPVLLTAMVLLHAASSHAQNYPVKPIRLIIPNVAGGPTDASGRAAAAGLEKRLGQPIVVETRPGANMVVGTNFVIKSEPDGYTLLFASTVGMHPVVMLNGVDVSKDLEPISNLFATSTFLVIRSDLNIRSMQELVAYSKANPGKLNFATTGATASMFGAVLKDRTGLSYTDIPYAGEAPAMTSLLGGQADISMLSIQMTQPQLQSGKVRAMFFLRLTRASSAPDVPTPAEAGVRNFSYEANLGMWAPKGTPRAILQRLSTEAAAAVKAPDMAAQVQKFGFDTVGTTAEEQLRIYAADLAAMQEAARLANFKPQ